MYSKHTKFFQKELLNLKLDSNANKDQLNDFQYKLYKLNSTLKAFNIHAFQNEINKLNPKDKSKLVEHIAHLIENYIQIAEKVHATLLSIIANENISDETVKQSCNFGELFLIKDMLAQEILYKILDNINPELDIEEN